MNKRKILSTICATAMAIPLALGLTGCKDNKESSKFDINAKDVYAISAVSSVNYLKQLETSKISATSAKSLNSTSRPSELTDENIKGIKDCLELFDNVIGENISQTTEKNTSEDPTLSAYNFVMTISVPGLEPMSMYYDEIETKTKQEIDDEDEEVEVSTTLSGIMVLGESTFEVSGKREFETEGDESESSIQFTTRSLTNSNNYIIISQSVENEDGEYELEYEYEIYINGEKVQNLEAEIEKENGKIELEFKLKDLSTGLPYTTIYKIENSTDEDNYVVYYFINGTKNKIDVEKTDTGYNFTYQNNFSEIISF